MCLAGNGVKRVLGDCLRYFVLNVNKNNFKQLLLVFKARPPVNCHHGRSWGCLKMWDNKRVYCTCLYSEELLKVTVIVCFFVQRSVVLPNKNGN